jgi:type III secretory pathway component EscU
MIEFLKDLGYVASAIVLTIVGGTLLLVGSILLSIIGSVITGLLIIGLITFLLKELANEKEMDKR